MADRPPAEAVRLMNGFRGYQLVVAACRLQLPDLVAAGCGDVASLAAKTKTHEGALGRVLRGLAAWGFFKQDSEGGYLATPISDAFRADRPGLRGMTMMLSEEAYHTWADLLFTLQTGSPAFEHRYGKSRWEWLAESPDAAREFNAAMVDATTRTSAQFLAVYDFDGVHTVADIAGGTGALLTAILVAHPQIRGILFDLPAGVAEAPAALTSAGIADRVTIVEGSFFDSVPREADLYLLKSIIHDWDDEPAVDILKTCANAMSREARLILLERELADDASAEALGTLMSDLNMMVVLGGRERTTDEYAALLAQAGLRITRTIPMHSDYYAIEAMRA
ncbi:MAG TPA: methyltransferase [Candidatus Dormibacteraeota bacterium]|nr:methyltransferase [Candidatus Dormibacteraeota bacterium]